MTKRNLVRMMFIAGLLFIPMAEALASQSSKAIVKGRVLSIDGTGVAGVRVVAQAVAVSGAETVGAATFESVGETGSDGSYRLENISPGRYYIRAGLIESPTYYPGTGNPADARTLALTAGSVVNDIDFKLARVAGVRVKGQIMPVPSSAVIARGLLRVILNGSRQQNMPATLHEDGTFEFQRVPAGAYTIRTVPDGVAGPVVKVGEEDILDLKVAVPALAAGVVVVEDGGNLPLDAWMSSRGTAMDSPIPIRVLRNVASAPRPSTVLVRADGFFVLAYGPMEERLSIGGLPFGYYTKSIVSGDVDLLRDALKYDALGSHDIVVTLMTIPPDPSKPGVRIAGRVSGYFPEPGGRPVGVSLVGDWPEGRTAEVQLQPDGSFNFQKVPPGSYTLRIQGAAGSNQRIIVADTEITGIGLELQTPKRF